MAVALEKNISSTSFVIFVDTAEPNSSRSVVVFVVVVVVIVVFGFYYY